MVQKHQQNREVYLYDRMRHYAFVNPCIEIWRGRVSNPRRLLAYGTRRQH